MEAEKSPASAVQSQHQAYRRYLRRSAVGALLLLVFVLLEGCYYMQAVGGQVDVLRKRRPVEEVIADEATDEKLRERLEMVQDARQFAVDELLLPENDSYRSYADMQRDYVLWNIFAAPEFSLKPKLWCYPVAGCVAYRGYFSEDKARKYADRLRKKGYDVVVSGVPAYSTLGRFDDPLLNTMMRWSDNYLVQTLFHELAHQKLYVKGDSAFNESFASAVAEAGIGRWTDTRGLPPAQQYSAEARILQREIRQFVAETREQLEVLYASEIAEQEMRQRKRQILDELAARAKAAIDNSAAKINNWLKAPLNNARLIPIGLYEGKLAAFQVLLADCDGELQCFYEQSRTLAELNFDARQQQLEALEARRYPAISSQPPAEETPAP